MQNSGDRPRPRRRRAQSRPRPPAQSQPAAQRSRRAIPAAAASGRRASQPAAQRQPINCRKAPFTTTPTTPLPLEKSRAATANDSKRARTGKRYFFGRQFQRRNVPWILPTGRLGAVKGNDYFWRFWGNLVLARYCMRMRKTKVRFHNAGRPPMTRLISAPAAARAVGPPAARSLPGRIDSGARL